MRDLVRIKADVTFKLNLKYFRHHTDNVSYSWNDCAPEVGILYTDKLIELLGPARGERDPLEQRHKDLARSAQAMYEEAFFALLNTLHRKHPSSNLALAGGCAMNSVANGKVYLRTPFRKMYLPAAAGDAGGAIGAACVVQSRLDDAGDGRSKMEDRKWEIEDTRSKIEGERPAANLPSAISQLPRRFRLETAYLGPHFSNDEIEQLLGARGLLSPVDRIHGSMIRAQEEEHVSQRRGYNF